MIIHTMQDGATPAQIGLQVKQIVIRVANFLKPEWSDLYQIPCANAGDCPAVEGAFHRDNCQYQFGLSYCVPCVYPRITWKCRIFGSD